MHGSVIAMPRPQIKPRHQEVSISAHAWDERWPQRAGISINRKALARKIKWQLTELAMSDGIPLDHTGAGWVEVYTWLWAVVRLTDQGWVVTTFVSVPGERTG